MSQPQIVRWTDACQVNPPVLIFKDVNTVDRTEKEFTIENIMPDRWLYWGVALQFPTIPNPFKLPEWGGMIRPNEKISVKVNLNSSDAMDSFHEDTKTVVLLIKWMLSEDENEPKRLVPKEIRDQANLEPGRDRKVTLEILRSPKTNADRWLSTERWTSFSMQMRKGESANAYIRPRTTNPVGSGGFSNVYRCELKLPDGTIPYDVAVKEVRFESGGESASERSERMSRRVEKELNVWKRLNHPNVMKMLGHFYTTQVLFISRWSDNGHVMAYLETHPQDPANRHRLIRECCNGMQYLHEQGVVHGDLRHNNVIVSHEDKAMITDFGLSKVLEGENPRQVIAPVTTSVRGQGQAFYMAPELQLLFEKGPQRTMANDVYAFGILMIEVASATLAFTEQSAARRGLLPTMLHYKDGKMLPTPKTHPLLLHPSPLWDLSRQCMEFRASERPTIEQCGDRLVELEYQLEKIYTPEESE
ncbi:hypothetical protein FRB99_005327 [Tulasnella sp. 403]|nr:hypothetical protein FRB99_005327 [Tulasnella sp. 403]